ncbi:general secretion pathway protein H [Andreprevotia lacus DSM 23236]|jgi:general secretion pathway protein H|uniref:Type II secretion system protein H n=1 Tax=Andreprevotia lacus DSM 23236 TaxID=1121001 RepID=A0A1W1XQK1_9NEIS|nr:GspH/FimT family pseudopilin [Andreprevotia lacus]SMC25788.1 general secretion pathway protein H [Andreprevotia lacus DSM 23236]
MRRNGFTLIEILVTLGIVAIVLGVAVVRLGESDGRVVAREAQRLALLLDDARDEAINGGRALAWSSDGRGYQFWLQDEQNNWQVYATQDEFRPRTLPEGMQVQHQQVSLRDQPLGERIVFEPSGVNQPFHMELLLGEQQWRLDGDVMGQVSASAVEAAHD